MPVFNAQGLPIQLVIQPDRNFAELASRIKAGQVLKGRVVEVLKGGKAVVNFRGISLTAALKGVSLARGETVTVVVQETEGTPVFRLLDAGAPAVEARAIPVPPPGIDPETAALLERLGLPRDEFHSALVSLLREYGGAPSREAVVSTRDLALALSVLLGPGEEGLPDGGSRSGGPPKAAESPGSGTAVSSRGAAQGSAREQASIRSEASPARPTPFVAEGVGPADAALEDLLGAGYLLGRRVSALSESPGGLSEPRSLAAGTSGRGPAEPFAGPGVSPTQAAEPQLANLLFAGTETLRAADPGDLLARIAEWLAPVQKGGGPAAEASRIAGEAGRRYAALRGAGAAVETAELLAETAGLTASLSRGAAAGHSPADRMTLEAVGFVAGVLHDAAARVFESSTGGERVLFVRDLPSAPKEAEAELAAGTSRRFRTDAPRVDVVRLTALLAEAAREAVQAKAGPAGEVSPASPGVSVLLGEIVEMPPREPVGDAAKASAQTRPETLRAGIGGGPAREIAELPDASKAAEAAAKAPSGRTGRAAVQATGESGVPLRAVPQSVQSPAEGAISPAAFSARAVSPRVLETAVFMHLAGLPPVGDMARAAHEYLFGPTRVQEVLARFESAAREAGPLPAPLEKAAGTALSAARSMQLSMERGRVDESLREIVERIGLDHESLLARAAASRQGQSEAGRRTSPGRAGEGESLKSAMLALRRAVAEYRAVARESGDRVAAEIPRLDASAREVLDLVQSQQLGSFARPDATQAMYVQVPILFGSELRGGELHLSWKRDRDGRKRDPRTPAVISVAVGTRSLGTVRASVTLTGQVLSVRFRLADKESASFVNAAMPQLKARLESLRFRVQGMSCAVEETAQEDAPSGALRPSPGLDLRA